MDPLDGATSSVNLETVNSIIFFKIITGWSIAKYFRGCHIFASNQIRTRDCWVRSTNTTSVLPNYNSLSVSVFSGSGGGEVVRT